MFRGLPLPNELKRIIRGPFLRLKEAVKRRSFIFGTLSRYIQNLFFLFSLQRISRYKQQILQGNYQVAVPHALIVKTL